MRSIAALVLLSTALFLPAPASAEEAAWLAGEMVQVAAHRTDLPLPRMSSQPLMGYLARPDEPGRHPAVIELHGCGGFGTPWTRAQVPRCSALLALPTNRRRCRR